MATRKKKRGKRGARKARPSIFSRGKSAPSSIFARAKVAPLAIPSPLGAVPEADWTAIDDMVRGVTFDELIRMDVDPAVAAELSRIDPEGWYVIVATVRGGSGAYGATEGERKGNEITNRVVLVGRGVRLWGRFLHLCDPDGGGSVLEAIEVYPLPPGEKENDDAFPLWSQQYVTTLDGKVIEGSGSLKEWESRRVEPRKRGPRKKSGGGMNADERRAQQKRVRERKRRAKATKKRIYALEDSKDIGGANRLRRKRDAAIKSKPRKRKPGKGRTR